MTEGGTATLAPIAVPPDTSLASASSPQADTADRDPRWVRPALLVLLAATGVLYLWGLGASGWANSFYSAAAQAGSQSWKAFFFGSSDASNSITVDKTPASLWAMALSVRVFGLSSWSILVPQALMGVATVGVLFAAVRRTSGPVAGLIAGAVVASTPVAALMFRFNNPDALLVLLLTIAAYCLVRAIESTSTKWLVWVGVLVGFGFLTKMLQAVLVVPGFALVYLVAADTPVRRRILQLLAAGGAMIAAAGWWVLIVSLIPAKDRPYIGGSQHNSVLELTLGYNGLGRLTGNETGSVGGGGAGGPGGAGGGMWGQTGWTRMFSGDLGGEISWLLPAALLLLVAGLIFSGRARRTDRTRAALLIWGSWLLVTGLVFSFMAGIFHQYYTVALAPAIGGVVGVGAVLLWKLRDRIEARATLAAVIVATVAWQYTLLGQVAGWQSWLRPTIMAAGLAASVALVAAHRIRSMSAAALGAFSVVTVLLAPSAYSVATAAVAHTGSIPTSGPAGYARAMGGPGGGRGFGPQGGRVTGQANGQFPGPFGAPGGQFTGQPPTMPGGGQGGLTGGLPGGFNGGLPGGTAGGPGGGAAGGLLDASTPSSAVVSLLKADSSKYTWVAAAVGSQSAAGFQLSTQLPVMPIGGFNGSDPSPTLEQFKAYVAAGKIHYFIGSGGGFGGQMGGSRSSSEIASWVEQNFTSTTVGGVTLYDLTQSSSSTTA